MKKIKVWLYNRFLPAWCKEDLLDTNAHLTEVIRELRQENDRLKAYVAGMQDALPRAHRITIRNGGGGK